MRLAQLVFSDPVAETLCFGHLLPTPVTGGPRVQAASDQCRRMIGRDSLR